MFTKKRMPNFSATGRDLVDAARLWDSSIIADGDRYEALSEHYNIGSWESAEMALDLTCAITSFSIWAIINESVSQISDNIVRVRFYFNEKGDFDAISVFGKSPNDFIESNFINQVEEAATDWPIHLMAAYKFNEWNKQKASRSMTSFKMR